MDHGTPPQCCSPLVSLLCGFHIWAVYDESLHSLGADNLNEALLVSNKCVETNQIVRRVERPFAITSLPWAWHSSIMFSYSGGIHKTYPNLDSFGHTLCPIEPRVLDGQYTVKKRTAFRIPMNR